MPNLGKGFSCMPNIEFSVNGIEKLLTDLKSDKATGPDNIPGRILKMGTSWSRSSPGYHLQEISWNRESTWWLEAHEKVWYTDWKAAWHSQKMLVQFPTYSDILWPCQDARQSTTADIVIMDFSNVFVMGPHQRLLLKLDHYGIRWPTNTWIADFLMRRMQRVVIGGEHSIGNMSNLAFRRALFSVLCYFYCISVTCPTT